MANVVKHDEAPTKEIKNFGGRDLFPRLSLCDLVSTIFGLSERQKFPRNSKNPPSKINTKNGLNFSKLVSLYKYSFLQGKFSFL